MATLSADIALIEERIQALIDALVQNYNKRYSNNEINFDVVKASSITSLLSVPPVLHPLEEATPQSMLLSADKQELSTSQQAGRHRLNMHATTCWMMSRSKTA